MLLTWVQGEHFELTETHIPVLVVVYQNVINSTNNMKITKENIRITS